MAIGTALLSAARTARGAPAAIVLIGVVVAAIFADRLAPYAYDVQSLMQANLPPSAAHLLGTDEFGRDLFSRILHGARISLGVAVTSIGASVALGLVFGAIAGYAGS
jgi:peptide/nickel transport system permease protein